MDSANCENLSHTWVNTKVIYGTQNMSPLFSLSFFATSAETERNNETDSMEQNFSCIDCHSFPLYATG